MPFFFGGPAPAVAVSAQPRDFVVDDLARERQALAAFGLAAEPRIGARRAPRTGAGGFTNLRFTERIAHTNDHATSGQLPLQTGNCEPVALVPALMQVIRSGECGSLRLELEIDELADRPQINDDQHHQHCPD